VVDLVFVSLFGELEKGAKIFLKKGEKMQKP
jgi:hypothetical protein